MVIKIVKPKEIRCVIILILNLPNTPKSNYLISIKFNLSNSSLLPFRGHDYVPMQSKWLPSWQFLTPGQKPHSLLFTVLPSSSCTKRYTQHYDLLEPRPLIMWTNVARVGNDFL